MKLQTRWVIGHNWEYVCDYMVFDLMTINIFIEWDWWNTCYCIDSYYLIIIIILCNRYTHNLAWLNVYYYYYLCDMLYVHLQRSYHALCHFILLLLLHIPSLYFTSLCCIVVNSTFFQLMIIALFFLFYTFPSYYSYHRSNNFCRNYHSF